MTVMVGTMVPIWAAAQGQLVCGILPQPRTFVKEAGAAPRPACYRFCSSFLSPLLPFRCPAPGALMEPGRRVGAGGMMGRPTKSRGRCYNGHGQDRQPRDDRLGLCLDW